jgi:hypothetical protein
LDLVRQYAVNALDNMAVPIATQPAATSLADSLSLSTATVQQRARYDASDGQLRRMRKMITNLVTLWGPFLKTDAAFATAILDFVSNRFLFVLSSSSMMRHVASSSNDGKMNDFAAIYQCIRDTTHWVDDPEFMVAAAPITGAALAYKVL